MTHQAFMSSINELDFFLRRQEFPENARNCLEQLHLLYASFKYVWNSDQLLELVNRHIFCLYERDVKHSRLSTAQKLELAEMILTYLTSRVPENERLVIFNAIFPDNYMYGGDVPLFMLSLITSLAIATKNADMLQIVAIWMTQTGYDSQAALYIAHDMVKDFISDEFPEKYYTLPKVSYAFAAVLLIVIGKAYHSKLPPARLIKQVTIWIRSCPSVVFCVPHSSVFELFRWVVNTENQELLLELLKSINIAGERIQQLPVIPHVLNLIQEIAVKIANLSSANNSSELPQKWTDYLFQLIQMLIGAGCLERNEIHPIFEAAQHARLPNTVLCDMMRSVYLKLSKM